MVSTMEELEVILDRAKQRAMDNGLPYAGALLPAEAVSLLERAPGATLVDVRTQAELYWVGRVPGAVTVAVKTKLWSLSDCCEGGMSSAGSGKE